MKYIAVLVIRFLFCFSIYNNFLLLISVYDFF